MLKREVEEVEKVEEEKEKRKIQEEDYPLNFYISVDMEGVTGVNSAR